MVFPLPKINFPITLAPMVGISHVAFRALLREYLPPGAYTLWPTEMLNARRLIIEKVGSTFATMRAPEEDFLVPQILGNEERFLVPSLEKLQHWGASAIDLNMGCPMKKILRHNWGVALMGDGEFAAEIIKIAVSHSSVPISVKLRATSDGSENSLLKFVEKLVTAGVSWVTLHPRTADQKRRGRADWGQIGFLCRSLSIPVIGNGDVQTVDDFFRLKEETHCQMVMVGRALTARPWLFWQVGEKLGFPPPLGREGRAPQTPLEEGREYGKALLRFVTLVEQYYPLDYGLKKIRFFVRTSHPWLQFGNSLYSKVTLAQNYDDTRSEISRFFSEPMPMKERTDLLV